MKALLKSATFIIAATVIVFALQSCNSVKPIDKAQLDGYWVLKTMNGQEAKTIFEGTIPSIEFNFADSMVTGNAGCNNYFGKFSLNEKNEFSASKLGMTLMMCIHANAEAEFAKVLEGTSVISVDATGLLTFTQNDKVIFQFEKGERPVFPKEVAVATPELIVGNWTLKTMEGADIEKLFTTNIPTIEFDTKAGKAFGNAGCNRYNTTYKLEEGKITFGPVMATKMACPSLEGEGKFVKLLETPFEASINDGDLTFYKDGKVILTFVKAEKAAK